MIKKTKNSGWNQFRIKGFTLKHSAKEVESYRGWQLTPTTYLHNFKLLLVYQVSVYQLVEKLTVKPI